MPKAPKEGAVMSCRKKILTFEEIEEIVYTASELGIKKIRITGGEPLIRHDIVDICRRISSIPGINETCITTNGTMLQKLSTELKNAGIKRINISLDSLNPDTYRKLTRGGEITDVLKGIKTAYETGFDSIKINVVLIGGFNDNEIRAFAEMACKPNIHVRFIELLPIGECANWSKKRYISGDAVLSAIPELQEAGFEGVARLYKFPDSSGTVDNTFDTGCTTGTVGIISTISARFCNTCNRIRVTCDGRLKPCLHSAEEVQLRGLHGHKLAEVMREAISNKPLKHMLDGISNSACLRNMNMVGG